jgi:hypothetical protein
LRGALTVLAVLACLSAGAHADIGINVYGLSYHFDRDKARERGLTHEFNPGLGVRWQAGDSPLFADVALYRDSAARTARIAGAGLLWPASVHVRLGAGLALFRSDTYNAGKAFIAPIPVAAYETRRVTFNVVYFPKWREQNPTNQIGAWLTLWAKR